MTTMDQAPGAATGAATPGTCPDAQDAITRENAPDCPPRGQKGQLRPNPPTYTHGTGGGNWPELPPAPCSDLGGMPAAFCEPCRTGRIGRVAERWALNHQAHNGHVPARFEIPVALLRGRSVI